ncbi:putative ribonuclease H-like domain-containing protein [Tanacetum coccineum]|uniref:Ribonuclease H-like domain-containing protein n=1 Tax=Tanacetum coccineum TaxID=301880 RepID=A0ABQ5IBL2_9ASTR
MKFYTHHHHLHIHHHKHQHNKLLTQFSTIKLPILKKGEYDIWAMKMEHYLAHTDYPIWEVIQNGNGPVSITTDTQGQIKVLPPRTAEEIVARERERKARTTLLMALPEDHLAKFHKMTDAKEMWDAIKSRFGGNDESKKMQKYILKQQFEGFSVSNSEGLHKGYDRFQSLLSQLEIHGAGVSTEDANQKFLRSLPSAWSQVSLIMRTKPGVDSLSFDDLYNNLRVFENDVKGSTASSSSTQNVAFVSENTSSTNDVSTAYSVSNPSGQNSQCEQTSSYSLLANQSSCPQLDHEDLEQLDEYDLEEMDLKWQVAMILMRMKKFYKKTSRKLQFDVKEPIGFDKTKVECYNCHKIGHFARECRTKGNQDSRRRDAWNSGNKDGRRSGKQEDSKALVTIDGEGVDWTSHLKEEEDYALMACNSSGSDREREQLSDASIEIKAYTQGLKNVEAQLVAHQQGQLWYEEKIRFDGILRYENEVLQSVFMNKESELEKQPLYDRFVTAGGMHAVPPPMTGNYMPSRPDFEVWSDAPIIEECKSDSEDEYVSIPTKEHETPSFANQQVKTPRETVKNHFTHSKNPKVDKKELGYGFTARACFVCGSLNHLIRDCDFHEKRMAKQAELNNRLNRKSSQREIRPIWNNEYYPQRALQNKGIVDSGCSRYMTGNKAYLAEYKDFNGGPVAFGGSKCYITGKGKIKIGKIDFEGVCFVKEIQHFNLFSVSPMYDKKNKVLFTNSKCLVLSPEFKLPDANQVLLRIPRQNNMYSFNLENIVLSGGLACLIAKAIIDESNKWHRRLGHVNFKNLNKLVKGNPVRGLPSKILQNDHTCVACQKGKQHKASCKAKSVSSISHSLQLLHMDLFGPTSVRSLNHKTYCLVITDDFSRFSWVFFLRTKDETSGILKDFIRQIENQLNQKVKTIRCDNGTEFKNKDVIEFCGSKGIKREYSNARTPQQNGVAERKNRTLIEAARTMLADSFLPNTFWAEAVSTACYVFNRVLVTKPHNKTPYELITSKIPIISYIRPFGCHVTILNTIDHLGKFDGKSDEGFLVGYSLQSKAFRVYNLETKRVEENLHITFLENKPNVAGKGPTWLFDLDYLTDSMNYQPVRSENQAHKHAGPSEANQNAGTEDSIDAGDSKKEDESAKDYFCTANMDLRGKKKDLMMQLNCEPCESLRKEFAQQTKDLLLQAGDAKPISTNIVNTASIPVSIVNTGNDLPNLDQDDSEIPALEDIYKTPTDGIFTNSSYDDEGAVADFTNLETVVNVSPIPTSRINSFYPSTLILRDPKLAVQTRSKVTKSSRAYAFVSYVQKQRTNNHKDFQHCLFACFLSQNKPKKILEALEDESWVDAMQEELMQFKIQKVWILVDLPYGRLVAQGHRQEEGIDYDEVFAPMARIKAIRIFLAFASYMGFIVYQMDVKSTFLYGKIDEEVYVSQPPGFLDPKYPQKVYKVVKALYGLHQAPRAWYATLSTFLLKNGYRRGTIDKTLFLKKDKHDIILVQVYVDDIIFGSTKKSWCDEFEALMKSRFQMSSMGELTFFLGLQVKQKADGIFISQDKYVAEILKKFDFVNVKTASTPIETQKPLVKDEEASDVDVHLYRSMIGSLMYLTASRPDIMFAVCACSRFQVTPKTSHLSAVKRIFRYLKGKPKLGLWYPRVSSFDLEAYSDSDYAGANLDRKSTTGGCQFLGRRLISWQCKKQTIVATSTTEAEYVAAASCCGQVLWIQNQMLDYGFNFMNTKIYIDNESTICIVKNPVYHSKTKHIAIRHHFIRDAYEKKLIQVLKIHTDDNVADLLTKAFDVSSSLGFRESLGRALDGTEALMLPKLFILWLATVSTDSAELVPMGKVSTAIETLKKNTAKSLISLSPTITHSIIMAVLESCPKHNMVAYLEKTNGNAEFHEIIDFLTRSSIHHALTVSPVVSTTFVEQFWMSAKSKIINNVRHITAKVAGKPMSISEASIRSDILFDDADGIDSLPNQAIFDAIQLMGYEGDLTVLTFNKALFSPQWRFLFHTMNHWKVTPLLASMLVQPSEDEGAPSERPFEAQPTPSPPHPSEATIDPQSDPSPRPLRSTTIPDSILETSGGNHGGFRSSQGNSTLEGTDQEAQEASQTWKRSLKKNWKQKEYVSKQGRKSAKAEPSVHKDPLFDEMPEDTLDYMETEDAQDVGRTRDVVDEEKENVEDVLSTAQQKVSTDKEKVSTNRPIVSTDGSKVSTNKEKDSIDRTDQSTDDQTEGGRATQTTQTPTSTIFGDDETIAQVLLNMFQAKAVSKEKEKGVEFKDIEETKRPRPTSTRSLLTLKPLPKIDPKDKGKKKIKEEDESESESDGIPEAEKKFKQLVSDEEMARKARIKADRLLAEKLQEEEREQFIIEEREKKFHDTIAAQRKFLAQQRSEAIRNRPPTKNQLRNQMMTYLKHVGNFKHSHLKTKKFEEIQALYEKIKRSYEDFISIGSAEDERLIKKMNEKGIDSSKDESVKEEGKEEEDSKIMEKKSVIARLNKVSSPDGDYLVIYRANGNFRAFNYLMEVLHIFDRQDLFHLYDLIRDQYSEVTLDGFELILWGDLKIMMESSTEGNEQSDFWSGQQDWNIVTWRLYESCGVCILEFEDGIVIHMLVEKRYPLSKDLLQRMLDLGLEVERESSVALDLIRFIKQQIDEE